VRRRRRSSTGCTPTSAGARSDPLEHRPFIVVGSGPAGAATALYLERADHALAGDGLVLEKAQHPREKVCAGGLIPHTLDCLDELDVGLRVANVAVTSARVTVPARVVRYDGPDLCWVVRRNELDHSLVQACRSRGIEIRERTKVVDLQRADGGIRVVTETEEFQTPLIIGADGSGSMVRRRLVDGGKEHVGKALMCDVPVGATRWDGADDKLYEFDFSPVRTGLRGYAWIFPCWIGGVRHLNVGVYASGTRGTGARLHGALAELLGRLGAAAEAVKSFPIRWYAPRTHISAPNVLLAGDAAGVDPLMGEGISFGFEYGRRAAAAIARAARGDDSVHEWYRHQVEESWMGRKLRRLCTAERLFYGRSSRLWFGIAARSRTAQDIGIRWYNGVGGMDRLGLRAAAWAWLRGDLEAAARRAVN
jgi:flavin-dependent dehydrogenase